MVEKTSGWGKAATILICAALLVIALCCLIPLWHVLISSFSDGQKLFDDMLENQKEYLPIQR